MLNTPFCPALSMPQMNIFALHMTIDNITEENYFHWSSKGRMDPGEDTGQMVLYFRRNVKVLMKMFLPATKP